MLQECHFLVGNLGEIETVVVHDVAAMIDLRIVDVIRFFVIDLKTFTGEVVESCLGWGEEQSGAMVAHDAVDFLGHAFVERTKSGLDVNNGHVNLGGGHSSSLRGVGVAIEHDEVGLLI